MDGKITALVVLLLYNLVLWVGLFYTSLYGLSMGLDTTSHEFTSELIDSYQDEYDTTELNISELNDYVEDNKVKIFSKLLFFNITNLGIWALFVVVLPMIASIGLGVMIVRGV